MAENVEEPGQEAPEPQKIDPAVFQKAVEEEKAKIEGEKKKPRSAKAAGAKKATKKSASTTDGTKPQPSAAKAIEIAQKLAAQPDIDITSGRPSINPRTSSRFRIEPQKTMSPTKREITVLPLRQPNKFEHVRVHPDIYEDVMIIRPKDSQSVYVVDTSMHDVMARWTKPATLRLAITSDGTHIVWPIPLPDNNGKDWPAWSSARGIAQDAVDEWCTLIWNEGQKAYDKGTTDAEFGHPMWNGFTLEPNAIDLMFDKLKDNFLEDMSHPLVKKLGLQATTAAEEAEKKAHEKERRAAEAALEAEQAKVAANAIKAAGDKVTRLNEAKAAKAAKKNGGQP